VKKLYRFEWDCGRQGTVTGIFVAEEDDVFVAIGKQVELGEALGKHSDVSGPLEEKDLTVLTEDQDFIAKFEEFGCQSGYNPLQYLSEGY